MDYPEAPGGELVQNVVTVRPSRRRSQAESRSETAVEDGSRTTSNHGHGMDERKYVQPMTARGAVVGSEPGDPLVQRLGDNGSPV